MSIKPGETIFPVASMLRAAREAGMPAREMRAMRSPLSATSARKRGAPVPSITVPPRITTSNSGCCARNDGVPTASRSPANAGTSEQRINGKPEGVTLTLCDGAARVKAALQPGVESLGHGTGLAGADAAGIHLDDRRDIRRRARDKELVEREQLLLGERVLARGDALLARDFEHELAGDARE